MVQGGQRFRFALEPRDPFRVSRDVGREHFQRNLTLQHGVGGAVDLAHAAGAEQVGDFVDAEPAAGRKAHVTLWIIRLRRPAMISWSKLVPICDG